jgi:hypothetical protein
MEKKRYFQYLFGANQGKVVEMTGLDTSDPDMTCLTFNDGSKCNILMIGKLNDNKAYINRMYMAEIYDPKNGWTFKDNSIKEDVRYGQAVDKDGNPLGEMAGVDPYVHGRFGEVDRRRMGIDAIPPKKIITKDEYQKVAQELESFGLKPGTEGFNRAVQNSLKDQAIKEVYGNVSGQAIGIGGDWSDMKMKDGTQFSVEGINEGISVKAPSIADIKRANKNVNTGVFVPDDIAALMGDTEPVTEQVEYQEAKPAPIEEPNNTNSIISEESKVMQSVSKDKDTDTEKTVINNTATASDAYKSSPIYNMVVGCKKKSVTAPLMLDLELPGKSMYNMIKENFDESCIDDFFNIIISDISTEQIKQSLKNALMASYEGKEET